MRNIQAAVKFYMHGWFNLKNKNSVQKRFLRNVNSEFSNAKININFELFIKIFTIFWEIQCFQMCLYV